MTVKEIIGQVTSNKMNKTVTVTVNRTVKHRKYSKIISRTKKYYAHDEYNKCKIGDTVKIQQSRPISKYKCWQVIQTIS